MKTKTSELPTFFIGVNGVRLLPVGLTWHAQIHPEFDNGADHGWKTVGIFDSYKDAVEGTSLVVPPSHEF